LFVFTFFACYYNIYKVYYILYRFFGDGACVHTCADTYMYAKNEEKRTEAKMERENNHVNSSNTSSSNAGGGRSSNCNTQLSHTLVMIIMMGLVMTDITRT